MSADMKAGRELDALIAERVMGWVWRRSNVTGRRCLYRENHWPEWMDQPADSSEPLVGDWDTVTLGNYSTDIAAAWAVIEAMAGRDFTAHIEWKGADREYANSAEVSFSRSIYTLGHAVNDSAATAICIAALKALESSLPPRPTGGEE